MKSVALSLNQVKFHTETLYLKDVTLSVSPGEFVTLMGENGSGKTTIVELLMGLRNPQAGEILFWGARPRLTTRGEINKRVGWVISGRESYPLRTSILSLFEAINPFYPTWDWELAKQLSEEFQLDLSKRLLTLSLGEQSKVKLIKALAFHPKLLVLDELTANLSPKSKVSILRMLLALFAEGDMGILYISHSNEEAQKLSDRVLLIEDGCVRNMNPEACNV